MNYEQAIEVLTEELQLMQTTGKMWESFGEPTRAPTPLQEAYRVSIDAMRRLQSLED